jgi:hypothetical protein
MLSADPSSLAAMLLRAEGLLSKTSSRLGVPSLLLFIGHGMLARPEGLLGIGSRCRTGRIPVDSLRIHGR